MAKLIKKGAEADIILGKWYDIQAVFKIRKPRKYMLPELDQMLRMQRTIKEAELIRDAKEAGVHSPKLYFVNLEDSTIVMEYIAGIRLKDFGGSKGEVAFWHRKMGSILGRLHKEGMIHGDPTTSNFIINNDDLVLLDFGLGFRSKVTEDRAVDIHLVKEILSGEDPGRFEQKYRSFLEGYEEGFGAGASDVVAHVGQIEKRGRYARSSWGE